MKLDKFCIVADVENVVSDVEVVKVLYFYKCGKCGLDMDIMFFKGVEIEKCLGCGVVLFDFGEFE